MTVEDRIKAGSTDINDLREFLNNIPSDKWCQNRYESLDHKQNCARGHLNKLIYGSATREYDTSFFGGLALTVWNDDAPVENIKGYVIEKLDEYIRERSKSS